MPKQIHIQRIVDGSYIVSLVAENGESLLRSESYASQRDAMTAATSIRDNGQVYRQYDILFTKNKGYQVILKAKNNQIIARTEIFKDKSHASKAIEIAIEFLHQPDIPVNYTDSDAPSNQTRIGSIRTFMGMLERITCSTDQLMYFRGHSNFEYKSKPGIYREKNWINNEDNIFKDLILRCPGDFQSVDSTFQALVKMQHYSLPTRLLDITSNPLIALYFACSGNDDKAGEVLAFRVPKKEIKYYDSDTVSVIANISRRPIEFSLTNQNKSKDAFKKSDEGKKLLHEIKKEKPYFESEIDPKHLESVICVKPKMDNARIIKQDGAFFIFGIDKTKSECADIPESYIASHEERMIIKSLDKRKILQQLDSLGINAGSIYPEIESVATHIKNTYQKMVP
jgi:uncharacterized protein YegP (UPF0339 family)